MMLDGEWIPAAIKDASPNLRYGVAPFPYPADHPERKGQVVLGGTVVAIPANVKDVDLAWKMLSWMEQPQTVADVMVNNGNLPTSKKAAAAVFRAVAMRASLDQIVAGLFFISGSPLAPPSSRGICVFWYPYITRASHLKAIASLPAGPISPRWSRYARNKYPVQNWYIL
jgi:ABC-type glycerol-3-phosphate transport system substrate-binding protein